jgi:hypothetical protein
MTEAVAVFGALAWILGLAIAANVYATRGSRAPKDVGRAKMGDGSGAPGGENGG